MMEKLLSSYDAKAQHGFKLRAKVELTRGVVDGSGFESLGQAPHQGQRQMVRQCQMGGAALSPFQHSFETAGGLLELGC
jgi:hypothetical protein